MANKGAIFSLQEDVSIEPFLRAVEAARVGFWDWDLHTDEVWISGRCADIFGVEPEPATRDIQSLLDSIMPADPLFGRRELERRLAEGGVYDQTHYLGGPDRWVRFHAQAGLDDAGAPRFASGSVENVSDARIKTATDSALLSSLRERIVVVDENGLIIRVNAAWAQAAFAAGADPTAVGVGCNYIEVCERAAATGCGAAEECLQAIRAVLAGRVDRREFEYECTAPGGPRRFFSVTVSAFRGEIKAVVLSHDEITQRKRLEEDLRNQVFTDSLTGLPNRKAFLQRVGVWVDRPEVPRCGVLLLGLDDFRSVNDAFGHPAGDHLLVNIGKTLSDSAGDHFVARLGGDQFGVLFIEDGTGDFRTSAEALARSLLKRLQEGVRLDGAVEKVALRATMAVSLHSPGRTGDSLIHGADVALTIGKQKGGNTIVFDESRDTKARLHQNALLRDLERALKNEELHLYYQPIVCAQDLRPLGAEALLRWVRPDGSVTSAGSFLSAVVGRPEEIEIDRWVFRQACQQRLRWNETEDEAFPLELVTINLSRRTLSDADFVDWFGETLAEFGIDGSCFAIEITEGAAVYDPSVLLSTCQQMAQRFGVSFWLDDVGKAYSSFEWLCEMPRAVAKLDPRYLVRFPDLAAKQRVAESVTRFVKAFGGQLVAECVEEPWEVELWRNAGCDFLQGYYFAKALSPRDLAEWLVTYSPGASPLPQTGSEEFDWNNLAAELRDVRDREIAAQWRYDGSAGAQAEHEWAIVGGSRREVRELARLITLAGKNLRSINSSNLAPNRLVGQSSTDLECWLNALRHHGIHRVVTRTGLRYEEGRIEELASASATLCRVIARKAARLGSQN